jgi:hypothetical protein
VSGGQLHQIDPALAVPQQLAWTGSAINGDVVVESQIQIDSVPTGPGVNTRSAAVCGGYNDVAPVTLYSCGLRTDDAGLPATVAAWHFTNPPTIDYKLTAATTGTMTAGEQAYVRLHTTNTTIGTTLDSTLDCFADSSKVSEDVPGFVADGYPGVRTLGVTASYNYLFVVAIGQ